MNLRILIVFCLAGVLSSAYASGTDIANTKTKAERGDAKAQFNLGMMYDEGLGVAENDVTAARWFRQSANQGNAHAQAFLGTMYARGKGVERNPAEAYAWLTLAAEQGIDPVKKAIEFLSENMTQDEIEQALELSSKYRGQYAPADSD